jgi:hypothetical protein
MARPVPDSSGAGLCFRILREKGSMLRFPDGGKPILPFLTYHGKHGGSFPGRLRVPLFLRTADWVSPSFYPKAIPASDFHLPGPK